MRLTPADLRRLAELAMLDLDDGEAEILAGQLSEVLERVDAMETSGGAGAGEAGDAGEPADPGPPLEPGLGPLRPDVPGADALATDLSTIAPQWEGGFFTVPRLESHAGEEGGA